MKSIRLQNNTVLNPVNKNRLHEEIVSQIENNILTGELKIGSKLPTERELALTLDVNRATVREALKKLEILGLIEIHHGDGIYVKDFHKSGNLELLKAIMYLNDRIDISVLRDLLDMRRIILPEMAVFAAERRSSEQLEDIQKAVFSSDDLSMLERDLAVHHAIARASGNLLYIFILNFFNDMFKDYGYIYFNNKENIKRSHKFHEDIYAAINAGDGKMARSVMRDVLVYTEKSMYSSLDNFAENGVIYSEKSGPVSRI